LANHKSALKRARQNQIRRLRNRANKTRIKNRVKEVRLAASKAPGDEVLSQLNAAKSVIDKAAQKGGIHKKTAARKISRLSKLVNGLHA